MQDSEYRSNGYNWYDTFPAFNIWRINATEHSWSLRKTYEATVPVLMLTSDRGMKVVDFLVGKMYVETPNNKVSFCSFVSYSFFNHIVTPIPLSFVQVSHEMRDQTNQLYSWVKCIKYNYPEHANSRTNNWEFNQLGPEHKNSPVFQNIVLSL